MEYHVAEDLEDAVALAQKAKGLTRFLAGGTDVLVQLRSNLITPDVVIDIKEIPNIDKISQLKDGSWEIGAAVNGAQMEEHGDLMNAWPGLVEAMNLIGSTQIQGRATLVGNLCNASPAADSVPAMIAADASVSILGPAGVRSVPVAEIPSAPGRTTLEPAEVIDKVKIPASTVGSSDAYLRFIPLTEMDIAVVGCAVKLTLDDAIISDARVALGAIAPTVKLVPKASEAIVGSRLDKLALKNLAEAAREACDPIDDKRGTIEYRTHIAGILAQRTAKIAFQRAKESL